ncbi:hypothetical protein [Bradyrhizobium sp.]|uniref:hypothetical protein n=1 Tax=Bradyrhizobium sp. TaxID=376 RepID=UPI003BB13D26
MKKPPGHDARRPLLRLPVSQFRRYPSTTRVRREGSTCKEKPASGTSGLSFILRGEILNHGDQVAVHME